MAPAAAAEAAEGGGRMPRGGDAEAPADGGTRLGSGRGGGKAADGVPMSVAARRSSGGGGGGLLPRGAVRHFEGAHWSDCSGQRRRRRSRRLAGAPKPLLTTPPLPPPPPRRARTAGAPRPCAAAAEPCVTGPVVGSGGVHSAAHVHGTVVATTPSTSGCHTPSRRPPPPRQCARRCYGWCWRGQLSSRAPATGGSAAAAATRRGCAQSASAPRRRRWPRRRRHGAPRRRRRRC